VSDTGIGYSGNRISTPLKIDKVYRLEDVKPMTYLQAKELKEDQQIMQLKPVKEIVENVLMREDRIVNSRF
jgi:hypothetical protein